MSNDVTVVARNLHKKYILNPNGSEYGFARKSRKTVVHAVNDVSFVAHRGESIGVVGHNGSGKSTLFRLISGGEAPTSGNIYVSSEPTLLGVSSALQPAVTGRLNVRLGLLAMGLPPEEVKVLEDEVCEWADIGSAIERPMKTYSSGMKARLVFSISTAVKRDILLIDEALSTGDGSFAARAKKRMKEFLDEAGTVFLVSHGAGTIKDHCNRALWLHGGEIIADGEALQVSSTYVRWSKAKSRGDDERAEQLIWKAKASYRKPSILFDQEAIDFLDQ